MMPKTELKPTTREERERWKGGHKYQPTDQSFTILRLIADVDRLTSERDYWKAVEIGGSPTRVKFKEYRISNDQTNR